MKSKNLPDFAGKVVYVSFVGEERYNDTVASPHWEEHNGKLFLVGTVPPRGSDRDWCVGVTTGIAWEHITDYLVFDSVKDYHDVFLETPVMRLTARIELPSTSAATICLRSSVLSLFMA
jgi:hypothetical protein